MTNSPAFTLRPAMLALDGDNLPAIPGYVREGVRWNGWECPVFDLDVLRAHRDDLAVIFPGWEGCDPLTWDADDMPHLIEHWEDEPDADAVSVSAHPDGRTLVDIGSWGYVWFEVEPPHTHYYDSALSEWQCRECDTCTDYCEQV